MSNHARKEGNPWPLLATGTLVLFVLAFGLRLANYQHEPITDELYHLIAAQSWAEDGSLAIADGEYRRASLFTRLVGLVSMLSDGSVDAIRIAGISVGAALVAALFLWTSREAGMVAGGIAALLLAVQPGAIFLSQHIRFYSLHALLFLILAWCGFTAATTAKSRMRWAASAVFLLILPVAIHLQVTTLIGVAGIALWIACYKTPAALDRVTQTRHRLMIVLVVLMAGVGTLVVARETIVELIALYRASALWNSGDGPLYYFNLYRHDLGWLWSLAPAAIIAATLARPALTLYCLSIFSIAFVLQSFGGMRNERFMFYALPFLFVIWGIAGDAAIRRLLAAIGDSMQTSRLFAGIADSRWVPVVLVATVAGFAILTIPAVETSAKMILGKQTDPPRYWDRYRLQWQAAAPELESLSAVVDVVAVSQPLHAVYYLGDYDYALNATSLADVRSFGITDGIDPRTGRPVFEDPATMSRIIDCNESGIVVIHGPAWRNPSRVPDALADVIEDRLALHRLEAESDLIVYRWERRDPAGDCGAGEQAADR